MIEREGEVDEESDKGNHRLGMDATRHWQGMDTAHANRILGLAISR